MAGALRRGPRAVGWPVISIGSLSAGGAGKTPVVRMLARLLAEQGVECDVLSRGYGRAAALVERVDPAGDAQRFGDEPLELARAGLEVWVGADRFRAGMAAEAGAEGMDPTSQGRDVGHPAAPARRRVHLLDDGFQHQRLARTLDVVLLTLADAQDDLLPAGNLREPLRALRRADVIAVREEEAAALLRWTEGRTRWILRRTMRLPEHAPERPLAFCGIARPENFFAGLRGLGAELAGTVAFADHHRYTSRDLDRLIRAAEQGGADGYVTTAKDAVKLTDAMRARLGHVGVVGLDVWPVDPETVAAQLLLAVRGGVRR